MIAFPNSTQVDKRIPKQKFYENAKLSASVKRAFVEQIKNIYWRNKLSKDTLNVDEGETVKEIHLIELQMYTKDFDKSVLQIIKSAIPYNIVFLISCDDEYQPAVFHQKLYSAMWQKGDILSLNIKGRTLDEIWNNFVIQISGIEITDGWTLEDQIAEDERVNKLKKEIEKLERMAQKEIQPKKKYELHQQIIKLKDEI